VETTSIGRNKECNQYVCMQNQKRTEPTAPEMVTPRLIALREALKLTKSEFADMIGIDRSSYTKIEKRQKPLLPKEAHRIWSLWGVDMNYIYLGQVRGLPSDLSSKIISHLNGENEYSA